MYPQTVSDSLWELLKTLKSFPDMRFCYLGGGTALALQIGHRNSEDLDFILREEFDHVSFKKSIQNQDMEALVLNQTSIHTEWLLQSVKVDLIKELIPLRFPLKAIHPDMENIKMADARDIGRMKIMAIGSRGSKKDFVDLYCLTRDTIPLESLLRIAAEKDRGVRYNKLLFLKGLVDFEEADKEGDLVMLWPATWNEVKDTLREEVKKIAKKI